MKKALSAILTGVLGIIPSTGLAQQQALEDRIKVTSPLIETEVRKWGPWVEEHIESDYTDGQRTKSVAIYFEGKKDEYLISPDHQTFASFFPSFNGIEIPPEIKASERSFFRGAVNHEITHFLFGEKGLMSMAGYSGPSREELLRHASQAMTIPENQATIKTAEQYFLFDLNWRAAQQKSKDIRESYGVLIDEEGDKLRELRDLAIELEGYGVYSRRDLDRDLRRIMRGKDEVLVRLARIDRGIKRINQEFSLRNLKDAKEKVDSIIADEIDLERRLKGEYIGRKIGELRQLYRLTETLTGFRIYREEFRGKNKENHMNEVYHTLKLYEGLFKSVQDRAILILDSNNELDGIYRPELANRTKTYSLNPEEFTARVVQKMAMRDMRGASFFAPVETPELTMAINAMQFNGMRVVGNIVDTYLAEKILRAQRHKPEDIQRSLSGNSLTLNGVTYNFGNMNNYTIIGTPRLEDGPK